MRTIGRIATAGLVALIGLHFPTHQSGQVARAEERFPLQRSHDESAMSWIEKTKHMETIKNAGAGCESLWNALWPYAKDGDLEARAILFFFMIPPPNLSFLYAPGNSGDLVSRQRDITIMAVHSQAYDGPFERGYRDLAYDQFVSAGFAAPWGSDFLECVKASGDNCADLAVKANLVPSFEDFAKQIDAMTAAGLKSTCE